MADFHAHNNANDVSPDFRGTQSSCSTFKEPELNMTTGGAHQSEHGALTLQRQAHHKLFFTNWNYFTKSSEREKNYVLNFIRVCSTNDFFFWCGSADCSKVKKDAALYTLSILLLKENEIFRFRFQSSFSLMVFLQLVTSTHIPDMEVYLPRDHLNSK